MKTLKTYSLAMKERNKKPKFWKCDTPALAKPKNPIPKATHSYWII
jgi:hypothetical protein